MGRLPRRKQVERFLSFEGENAARMVNNLDWTAPMSAIDFLRDIGKHYRVGTMLKKDAVSARLNSDEGISYTEFSYQILQGLDYRELFLQYGCVLQTGGSDQWGNLTSGVDLIHRAEGRSVHAIGTPLITNSDGRKFGKSEGNAIWLDPALTSPYAMYQFWLNTDDADVADRLKVFTFLTRAEIEEIVAAHDAEPFRRIGQKRVALEVTSLVHGPDAAAAAIAASEALFGQGDLTLARCRDAGQRAARAAARRAARGHARRACARGAPASSPSLSEARRAIAQGGVSLDGVKVEDDAAVVSGSLPGGVSVLRRGKKTLAGVFVRR